MRSHLVWLIVLVSCFVMQQAEANNFCMVTSADNVRNAQDVCSNDPGDYAHLKGFQTGNFYMTCPLGFSGGGTSLPWCHHAGSGTFITSYVTVTLLAPSPTDYISVGIGNFRDSCSGTYCDYVQVEVYTCTTGQPVASLGYVSVVGRDHFRTRTFFAPGHDCFIIGRWGGGNAYPNARLYFVTEAMP